jgi:hypothetical protein
VVTVAAPDSRAATLDVSACASVTVIMRSEIPRLKVFIKKE